MAAEGQQPPQAHDILASLGLCASSQSDAVSESDKLISQGAEAVRTEVVTSAREGCVLCVRGPAAIKAERTVSFFPCLQRVFKISMFEKQTIVKQRFNKRYRLPELDAKLTKSRMQAVRGKLPLSQLVAQKRVTCGLSLASERPLVVLEEISHKHCTFSFS